MADIVTSLVLGAVATFIPLYVGIFLPSLFKNSARYSALAAISAGIIFWFFVDVMNDSVLLDVNQGFGGDITHPVLAAMFAIGVLILFGLERVEKGGSASVDESSAVSKITYAVAAIAALGIGFHAIGEGIEIGSLIPNSTSILDAIGGLSPGVAYVLHKLLEGFVIGTFAVIARATSAKKLGILGLIAGIPTILGFFIGIPVVIESTYFFALGAAGAVYIELNLVPWCAVRGSRMSSVVLVLVGFYLMYIAGLFHGQG